jgi:hypothetical protein
MGKEQTVLEAIIEEVATDLYNKWSAALPEEEKKRCCISGYVKECTRDYIIRYSNIYE